MGTTTTRGGVKLEVLGHRTYRLPDGRLVMFHRTCRRGDPGRRYSVDLFVMQGSSDTYMGLDAACKAYARLPSTKK